MHGVHPAPRPCRGRGRVMGPVNRWGRWIPGYAGRVSNAPGGGWSGVRWVAEPEPATARFPTA